jgi:isochorismate pyruvate lyase
MTQAARIKQCNTQVRDETASRPSWPACAHAATEGGQPEVMEAIYRSMMEAYIAYEHRVRAPARTGDES